MHASVQGNQQASFAPLGVLLKHDVGSMVEGPYIAARAAGRLMERKRRCGVNLLLS
jgi:hypothetical protein